MFKNFNRKTIFRDRDAARFWHYYIPQKKLCEALRDRIIANKDSTVLVTGSTGCLTGDTEIKIICAKKTKTWKLKDLYSKFNTTTPFFIRSFNGKDIKLNKIKKVLYSGKKEVHKLILKNGLKIKATKCHRIMTKGGWVELKYLNEKDLIMCNEPSNSSDAPKFSEVKSKIFIGIEDTYDISCEDPHNNFVANDIVVHNSGKSTLIGKLCFNFFQNMDNVKIEGEKMFSDDNFVVDPEIWATRMITDKGSVLFIDEGRDGISSKSWNSKINKTIVSRKNKNRKRGIVSFILLPYETEVDKSFLKHITMWVYVKSRGIAEVYVASNSRKGGQGLSVQRIIDREAKWFKENPKRRAVDPTINSEYIGSVVFSAFSKAEEKRYNKLVDKHHATGKLSAEEEEKINPTMDKQELEKQIPLILDEVEAGTIKSKRDMWEKLKEITKFDDALLIRHINRHLKIRGFKNFNSFHI